MKFAHNSRSRLTPRDLDRFDEATLLGRIARTLCQAECIPRKELYEAWEVARRTRRRFRGGRVLDLACGHALLAHLMLLLDDTSELALAVDSTLPPSAHHLAEALAQRWPRLAGRVQLHEARIRDVQAGPDDLIVSCHACGTLSDAVLETAIAARARVVVLPCCHSHSRCDQGGLGGWLDPALAIDVTRAARLRAAGFQVHTQTIPAAITPKNRLLLAWPDSGQAQS